MKAKKLIIIGAVCVLIVIGALAAVPFFIDTQSLKNKLVNQAEAALHRRMSVQGVELTIFTGLGVRLNRAVIFDDLKFSGGPFITLNSVTVRPRLLPLLRGSVEVASIELDQPEIRLIQNAQRAWNFESIGTPPAGGSPTRPAAVGAPPAAPPAPGSPSQRFTIALLDLRDGVVAISKRTASGAVEESRYDHIYLKLRDLSTDEVGTFDLRLQLPPSAQALQAKGQLGPVNLSPFSKTPWSGEIQFSELPVARLTLCCPRRLRRNRRMAGSPRAPRLAERPSGSGIPRGGQNRLLQAGRRKAETLQSPYVDRELRI